MKIKILLLGGSGFVGESLIELLNEKRLPFSAPDSSQLNLADADSTEKFFNTLSTAEEGITIIFSASKVPYRAPTHDDFKTMMENVYMAENVCRAMSKIKVREMIYISTIDVYGKPSEILTENTPLNPQTNYAISKLAAEFILKKSCLQNQLPFLCLRLSQIIGARDDSPKIVNSFINSALKNSEINLTGGKDTLRDFVLVSDAAKIIYSFIGKQVSDDVNIATGHSISFYELAELVKASMADRKITIVINDTPYSKPVNYRLDISRLKNYEDYKFTSIEESIKAIVAGKLQ